MSEQTLQDRPIFILGTPRSGTSLTAGIVARCGAWLGDTVPAGRSNPTGYFENRALREKVVKRMLRKLRCDPLGVQKLPGLEQVPVEDGLRDRVLDEIARQGYTGGVPWAFKGAKLTLLWPAWHRAFPAARWVIVRREPEDIVRSCLATHFMVSHSRDPVFWREFVAAYRDRLDALERSGASCRVIWPHALVAGDRRPMRELVEALDLTWEKESVERLIEPRYWHGSGPIARLSDLGGPREDPSLPG